MKGKFVKGLSVSLVIALSLSIQACGNVTPESSAPVTVQEIETSDTTETVTSVVADKKVEAESEISVPAKEEESTVSITVKEDNEAEEKYEDDLNDFDYENVPNASEFDSFDDYIESRVVDEDFGLFYGGVTQYCSTSVALVDVNQDGCEDLVVSGALGLRSKGFTDVILNLPEGFKELSYDGALTKVVDNRLFFTDCDYSGAGETTYDNDYVVEIDNSGNEKVLASCELVAKWYDSNTDTAYEEPIILKEKYTTPEQTKEEYEALVSEYLKGHEKDISYKTIKKGEWRTLFEID